MGRLVKFLNCKTMLDDVMFNHTGPSFGHSRQVGRTKFIESGAWRAGGELRLDIL